VPCPRAPIAAGALFMKHLALGSILLLTILLASSCDSDHSGLPADRPPVAWSGTSLEIGNDQVFFADLNITRAETNAHWSSIESTKGVLTFEKIHDVVTILTHNGVTAIALAIYPENPLYNDVQSTHRTVPHTPMQWNAYRALLTALVGAFKGDAHFYQIVREINPARFLGTAEDYARLLVFSSDTIKAIDPEARIVLAALPYELCIHSDRETFLADVIRHLPSDKQYFDAVDIHIHRLPATMGTVLSVSNGSDYVGIAYDHFCKQLSGTMYDGSPVFFETSSYSAERGDIDDSPPQTEEEQARDLERRLGVLAQRGVYWINLEGGIYQRRYFAFDAAGRISNSLRYFEYTGLIWNPDVNEGRSGKKDAFYFVEEWNN
jgi:hypothetical protein